MFQVGIIAALHHEEIKSHCKRISTLTRFGNNYDCGGLEFPLPINGFSEFERRNDVIINVLGVKGNEPYIPRLGKYE